MVGFYVNLDQTVQESCKPEEPFEESSHHHKAHDGDIYNLCVVSRASLYSTKCSQLTSATGQGAVMGAMPVSVDMVCSQRRLSTWCRVEIASTKIDKECGSVV